MRTVSQEVVYKEIIIIVVVDLGLMIGYKTYCRFLPNMSRNVINASSILINITVKSNCKPTGLSCSKYG